jgi:hypothetical protein
MLRTPRRAWELQAYNFVLDSDVDIVLNLSASGIGRTVIFAPSTSYLYIPQGDF